MATKEEMCAWFAERYELAVDAWFYDTEITDLQRVAAAVDVARVLTEHFPGAAPETIEGAATDLATEGTWIDPNLELGAEKED